MEYQIKSLDNMKMTIRCDISSLHKDSLEGKGKNMKHKKENWYCSPEQVTDSIFSVSDSHTTITSDESQSLPYSEALTAAPNMALIKQEPAWNYEDFGSAQFSDCASSNQPVPEVPEYTVLQCFPDVTQCYQTRVKTEPDLQSTVPDLQSTVPDLQSAVPDLQSTVPSTVPDLQSTVTSSEPEANVEFDPKIVSVCSLAVPEYSQFWEALGSAFQTRPVAEVVGVSTGESLPALVKTEPDLGFESECTESEHDLGALTENCGAEYPPTVPMNYLQAECSRFSSLRQAPGTSGFSHFQFDSEKRHFLHRMMGRSLESKQSGELSLHLKSRREEVPNTRLAFQMNVNPPDEFMFKSDVAADVLDNYAKSNPSRDETDFDLGACKPDLDTDEPYSSTSELNISDCEGVIKNEPLSEEEDGERAEDESVMSEGEEDEEGEEEREDLPVHFDPSLSDQTFSTRSQQMAPSAFVATRMACNPQQLPQGDTTRPRHVCGLCKAKFSSDLQCISHMKEQHMHCFRTMRGLQPSITKSTRSLHHDMAYRMKHDGRMRMYNRSGNLNGQMQPTMPILNGRSGRAGSYMMPKKTGIYIEQQKTGKLVEQEETGLYVDQQKTSMHEEQEKTINCVEQEKVGMSGNTAFVRFIRNTRRTFPVNTWQPDLGATRIPCKPLVNSIRIMADENGKHHFFTCKSDDSKMPETAPSTMPSQNSPRVDEEKQKKLSVCSYCRLRFSDRIEYLMHLQLNHSITDMYSCSSCQQYFINVDEHLKRDGMTHQIQKVRNLCFQCNRSFSSANGLRGHMRCHLENRVLKCDRCNKVFTQAYTLALHRRTHFVPKELVCPVCFRTFSWSNSLRYHMRKHTGERPFACQTCLKSFSHSSNLKAHIRTHTGEKPFQCSTCLAAFTTSSALTVHKWQHTDAKPFHCDACDKDFSTSNSYKRHQALHTGQRDYQCEYCCKTFTQSSSLNVHRRQHTGERPFFCTQCGASFMQSAHLTVHVRKHTGERPFVCKVCRSAFSRSEYLLRHCRMRHGAEASKPRALGKRGPRLCRQWMSKKSSVVK